MYVKYIGKYKRTHLINSSLYCLYSKILLCFYIKDKVLIFAYFLIVYYYSVLIIYRICIKNII